MTSPLSGQIAKVIGGAFSRIFLPAELERAGATTGPSYDPAPGAPTAYTCRAIVEKYSERYRAEGLVHERDRKVLVLTTSLSVRPQAGDRITVRGVTFTAMNIETDPAEAVWVVQGRM